MKLSPELKYKLNTQAMYWTGEAIGLIFLPGTALAVMLALLHTPSLRWYIIQVVGFSFMFWAGIIVLVLG